MPVNDSCNRNKPNGALVIAVNSWGPGGGRTCLHRTRRASMNIGCRRVEEGYTLVYKTAPADDHAKYDVYQSNSGIVCVGHHLAEQSQ